jgi:ABC-type iron transport system FetAB ATPase subunit
MPLTTTADNSAVETLLHLSGVAVASHGVRLLKNIDLTLTGGEMTALKGPSGCGKTSMLRAIAGLTDPVSGTVSYRGKAPAEMGWPRYRRQVILVEQRPTLLDMTVLDNLKRPFSYRSNDPKTEFPMERAHALLTVLGVGGQRLDQGALSLSVGQQQRVCLVRALLLKPAILLLDEPTSALDGESMGGVAEVLIQEQAQRDLTALIVSHDENFTTLVCGRTFHLEDYALPHDQEVQS